jgi:hypothetical protein
MTELLKDNPDLAKAVHETATQKLNDPEWEPFPITLLDGDIELGQRAFEVLWTLGYAKETLTQGADYEDDKGYLESETYRADYIHPRAKEYLIKYGKDYVECLEAFMRLTNQQINRL